MKIHINSNGISYLLLMGVMSACGGFKQSKAHITLGSNIDQSTDPTPAADRTSTPASTGATAASSVQNNGYQNTGISTDPTHKSGGLIGFAVASSAGSFTRLTSPSGAYNLVMQSDGNLVENNYLTKVWSSGSSGVGSGPYQAVLQSNGTLAVLGASGATIWSSGTGGKGTPPYELTVQNDGNVVLFDATNTALWSTNQTGSSQDLTALPIGASVASTGNFTKLTSPNGAYTLAMQANGNLVESAGSTVLWTSNTAGQGVPPYTATMQNDGNFVVYDSTNKSLWDSGTNGQGTAPYTLVLNNYGNVKIYDTNRRVIWSMIGTLGTLLVGASWSPPIPSLITNQPANRCLSTAKNGVQTILWDCVNSDVNQAMIYSFDQQLQIGADLGRCLTYETPANAQAYVDTQPCSGATLQRWSISAADGSFGVIHPLVDSSQCLDVASAGTADNTAVIVATCNSGASQNWTKKATGSGIYNPNLPWWPDSSYTDPNTQSAQRAAWLQVTKNLTNAINSGLNSFTIPAGIYRTGGVPSYISSTTNFTLNAAGVEIMAENADVAFYLANNKNFVLNGPLNFDSYPGIVSQGQIVNSDASSFISFNLKSGSPGPQAAPGRIMLFDTNGQFLSQDIFQYGCVMPGASGNCGPSGSGAYTISNFTRYTNGAQYGEWGNNGSNVAAGNYIMTYQNSAGILLQSAGDTAFTLNDINMYGGQLLAQPQWNAIVNMTFNHVTSPRRPGTSRLVGGADGFFGELTSGSLNIFESDIAWATDDVTDPFSVIMFGAPDVQQGVAANQLLATGWGPFPTGDTINIYDPNTLQLLFSGPLSQISQNSNGEYLMSFKDNLPTLSPKVIIDDSTQQQTVIFADSYFHDAQSNGMQSQGGKLVKFTNNYVRNAAVSVTGDLFPQGWGPASGGIPIDVIINNNTMNKEMLYQNPIVVKCDSFDNSTITGTPIQSVTVQNNLMMSWQGSGPAVSQAKTKNISGNVITDSLPNF